MLCPDQVYFLPIEYHLLLFTECPDGFQKTSGVCLRKGYEAPFLDAEKLCQKFGGFVVEPRTQTLNDIVKSFVSSNVRTYIGLTDIDTEGNFVWQTDKSIANYTDWKQSEPNGQRRENCVIIHRDTMGWHDVDCNRPLDYVCQAQSSSKYFLVTNKALCK